MKKILLVEPDYKNKYPPLGLMKISTYHKQKGHKVIFAKGCYSELKSQKWDRIYITTLFTFYWRKTVKTIRYYLNSVKREENIFIGGVMATLMKNEIVDELPVKGITIVSGLLNEKGKLRYSDDFKVDFMTPDYSIIDIGSNKYLDHIYPTKDSYIGYTTRGCIRKCQFCAVPKIEPKFHNGISVKKQINSIRYKFGEKRNLLLMDNNVLAAPDFDSIIEDIKEAGFAKGSKYTYVSKGRKISVKRTIDFNQGIDARLLNEKKMKKLSEISIEPLRIAFDDMRYKDTYVKKVRLAAKYEIKILSNYILFNFKDTPDDFYERLKINIELNEEFMENGLISKIWSFPMKYSPIFGDQCKTRKYIGKHWNKKYLRAIQCILIPTHGVVGPNRKYFERAFGRDKKEFKEIMLMPEKYIIYRAKYELNRKNLLKQIQKLSLDEKQNFYNIILNVSISNLYFGHSHQLNKIFKEY